MGETLEKLGYAAALAKAKLTGRRVPLYVEFALLYGCNLKCVYCYGEYGRESRPEMPLEQVFSILDQLRDHGTRMISLSGGEPTLRKDIGRIVERAKTHGMHVGMVSNGALVARKIEELRPLNRLVLSLDGAEANHDRNRGVPSSYRRVMEAAEAARKAGIYFTFKMVVTRHTAGDLDFVIGKAKEFGTSVEVTLLYSQKLDAPADRLDQYRLDREENLRLLRRLRELKDAGEPVRLNPRLHDYLIEWQARHQTEQLFEGELLPDFRYVKCYAGHYTGFIHHDGELYSCNQMLGRFPAKNILKVGFQEAWEHLTTNTCRACSIDFLNEKHLFHGLDPAYLYYALTARG